MDESPESVAVFAAFYFDEQPVGRDDAAEIAKDILLGVVENTLVTAENIRIFTQKVLETLRYCKERGNPLPSGSMYLANIDTFDQILPGIPEKWLRLLEGESLADLNTNVVKFIENVPANSPFLMGLLYFVWDVRLKKYGTSSGRIQRLRVHEAPGSLLDGKIDPDAWNVPWDLDSDYDNEDGDDEDGDDGDGDDGDGDDGDGDDGDGDDEG
jgi:hypothetical protein